MGKLRNPFFGNILIALYKEILLILKSEKIVFIVKGFNLVLGGTSKSIFGQYFSCVI